MKVKARGFTLIELVMTIAILGVIAVATIDYLTENIDEANFDATVLEMKRIKVALIGEEDILGSEQRRSFGYQGDIGALPGALSGLTDQGALPAWNLDTTTRLSLGWNGPYIQDETGNNSFLTDAWGNSYVYNGATNPATLISYGADGVANGTGLNSDITVSIPTYSHKAIVYGFISLDGAAFSQTATVELYQPNGSGALQTQTSVLAASANGAFTFTNVPFGERAIKIFVPDKTTTVSTIGPVVFTVGSTYVTLPDDSLAFADTCTQTNDIIISTPPNVAFSTITNTNDTINFNYNVASAVTISKIKPVWVNSRTLSEFRVNNAAVTYTSSGGANDLFPRNATKGVKVTLNPTYAHAVLNNRQARFKFSNNLTSVTPSQAKREFSVWFYHTNGCSLIEFTMP